MVTVQTLPYTIAIFQTINYYEGGGGTGINPSPFPSRELSDMCSNILSGSSHSF